MKISHKGPADTELPQLIKNEKTVSPTRRNPETKVESPSESTKVSISEEARKLQRIAELARAGDESRAEKVKAVKQQVSEGDYHADSTEVAKSILRSEITRLLKSKS